MPLMRSEVSDWKEILLRTKEQISKDNVGIVAAGVAFYALLSIPFILTAVVSIYGIAADPAQVQNQLAGLQGVLPGDARSLLSDQLTRVSAQSSRSLSIALIGSVLLALWSGSKAVKALMTSLNIAYDEEETRGFIKLNLSALLLTLAGVLAAVLIIGLVVAIPALIGTLELPEGTQALTQLLRWPLLAALAIAGLAVIYRYAPSRDTPQWRWVSWGSVSAGALWLIGSALFSWYVSSFGNYNQTYGSLGAVVIMLMWFYLSSYIVILGAEINSEMERQTRKDNEARPESQAGKKVA